MPKTAVFKVYGDIGVKDGFAEAFGITDNTVGAAELSQFLDENKDATDITVRINSRGGDVQEGYAMYDLLTTCGKKIKTIGEGKVYSIATIVFLAGSEREMMANADGLIHNPYIPQYTLADSYESGDLLKIAENLQQEEAKMLDFYVEKTGADKATLAEYMKEETKLSAEDMVKLGFATKVVEPIKAFAYVKPKNLVIMDSKEQEKFFDKVGTVVANAIAALGLSRLPAVAQTLTDKDGKQLKLEKESGEPAVGDAASPDGSYTMENGDTITVSGGKITEITNGEPAMEDKDAEIARLKAALEAAEAAKATAEQALADANAEKDTAVATAAAAETAKAEYEAKKTEAAQLVNDLTELKNQWQPAARGTGAAGGAGGTDPKEGGKFDEEQVRKTVKVLRGEKVE